MTHPGKLTFLCGKMAAGKSTKSVSYAAQTNAVLISEDVWLEAHYPTLISSFDDYIKYTRLIKPFIKSHVKDILNTGANVVMDFPANTIAQRNWFVELCQEINSEHEMLYVDKTNEVCLQQLAKRRIEQPHRARFDTETVFNQVTQLFEYPSDDESINTIYCR